ncbi:MAG: class I SAM-dependent methyltransferase [Rhodospirillaceae bacterium]
MRNKVPVMQNYVYFDYNEAMESPYGDISLTGCLDCGFVYNRLFNQEKLRYDSGYDNCVPSNIFLNYYKDIANYLYSQYDIKDGLVIDIGCGKGEFIRLLCSIYPDVAAIGIDPTCRPNIEFGGRLQLIKSEFSPGLVTKRPALVISRHVVEHISSPALFLNTIRKGISRYPETPVFIEVPDLNWIVENDAYWDICYEHCNYFTNTSICNALQISGFDRAVVQNAFGGQYLWAESRLCSDKIEESIDMESNLLYRISSYETREKQVIALMKGKLEEFHRDGYSVVVWGMATKGVVFCNLIDPNNTLINYCIDVNPGKHNAFVPLTGHKIQAPDDLCGMNINNLIVIVMNMNYLNEIKECCAKLWVYQKAIFMGADGIRVNT